MPLKSPLQQVIIGICQKTALETSIAHSPIPLRCSQGLWDKSEPSMAVSSCSWWARRPQFSQAIVRYFPPTQGKQAINHQGLIPVFFSLLVTFHLFSFPGRGALLHKIPFPYLDPPKYTRLPLEASTLSLSPFPKLASSHKPIHTPSTQSARMSLYHC